MIRIITSSTLILLVFSLVLLQNNATAQPLNGQWIFDNIINSDVDPLEISGGAVFPGIDTFIVLDDNNLSNLMVYNINRSTRSVESTSTISVNTPAFGLGHVIHSANGTAHSCFTDNFALIAVQSQNGTDWNRVQVAESAEYDSCETAVSNGDVFIGACNADGNAYMVFQSQDNGLTWNQIQAIKGVLCPSDGGTRPTFNMINGEPVIFYMTGFNGGKAVENDQNTTRLIEDGELVLFQGGQFEVLDMDSPGRTLAESFPPKVVQGFIVAPYYHRDSGTIKLLVEDLVGFFPPFVVTLGDAPLFTTFFGVACAEGPEGIVNVITPGRHFQFSLDTNQTFQISQFPFMQFVNGPIAVSNGMAGGNGGGAEVFFASMFTNSIDYALFGRMGPRPIPTLSEWGLIALAGILMLSGAFYLRRKVNA